MTLTLDIPREAEEQLRRRAEREHRTPEEAVWEILRRELFLDRFDQLCRETEPYFRAAGYEDEDQILREIS